MWAIFKAFIECCNIAPALCFGFMAMRHGGPYSLARMEPTSPALKHWSTRKVPCHSESGESTWTLVSLRMNRNLRGFK